MKRLSRRQRRALAALGQDLLAQDPELAAQLNRPPVLRRQVWAARLSSLMLVAGVVMLASGILFGGVAVGGIGATLLLSCWMPPKIAAPDTQWPARNQLVLASAGKRPARHTRSATLQQRRRGSPTTVTAPETTLGAVANGPYLPYVER